MRRTRQSITTLHTKSCHRQQNIPEETQNEAKAMKMATNRPLRSGPRIALNRRYRRRRQNTPHTIAVSVRH